MVKDKFPKEEMCDCGGEIVKTDLKDKDGTPKYRCNRCGKFWYNERDL